MSMNVLETPDEAKVRLRSEVGDVSGIRLMGNKVLVAIYRRPEMTAGGIIMPEKSLDEDKYQGKVGLVLSKGPQAFVDDDRVKFNGVTIEPGEWVIFKTSETWPLAINDKKLGHCRMIDDIDIRAVIDQPEKVW